jgi:hypothetical protein
MARLLIIYDPDERVTCCPPEYKRGNLKEAVLDISNDIESQDIYNLARKLAELLLEQL